MNRDNLITLATYLESLPKDYAKFEMKDFMAGELATVQDYARRNGGCPTAACAVGHGPSAGFLFDDSLFGFGFAYVNGEFKRVDDAPMWPEYCDRYFVEFGSEEFEFMFGGGWSSVDNTVRGAAARIRYLLAGHDIPDTFDEDGDRTENFNSDYANEDTVELYKEYVHAD